MAWKIQSKSSAWSWLKLGWWIYLLWFRRNRFLLIFNICKLHFLQIITSFEQTVTGSPFFISKQINYNRRFLSNFCYHWKMRNHTKHQLEYLIKLFPSTKPSFDDATTAMNENNFWGRSLDVFEISEEISVRRFCKESICFEKRT